MRFRLLVALGAALALAACGAPHHAATLPNGKPVPKDWQVWGGHPRAPGFGQPPKGDFGLPKSGLKSTFTIQGYDAVYVPAIPRTAQAAGCYNSGYPNCSAVRARATIAEANGRIVTIATRASVVARCLDVEPGDAYPSQAPGWVRWMISLHLARPCVYADASHMGGTYGVRAYMARSGLARSAYSLWIADWDGNPTIPSGYDAKQWHSILTIYGYDNDTFGSWFFSTPPSVDTHSYREGFVTGYATGRSAPYKTGFTKTFKSFVPKVQKDYNSGWSVGWKSGHRTAYNLGLSAGRHAPVSPKTWSGSWALGFDKCWAGAAGLGVGGNYWAGFAVTKHGSPSSWTAYGAGCAKGKPGGYSWDWNNGSRSGSYYTYARLG